METALLDVWWWKEEDKWAVLPLSQVRKHEKHQLTTALVASMWFLTWPLICSSIFASQDRVRRPKTPESRSIDSVKFVSYKSRLFFFAFINWTGWVKHYLLKRLLLYCLLLHQGSVFKSSMSQHNLEKCLKDFPVESIHQFLWSFLDYLYYFFHSENCPRAV